MSGRGMMGAVLALIAAAPALAQQDPAAVEVPAFTLPPSDQLPRLIPMPYMAGAAEDDGAAYPLLSEAETRLFPPTLLLAGSRDFAASALTLAHRRLTQAGVPSQLFLFDGLPHAFFVWPDMPESMEAYRIIARFFDQHLGRRK